MKMREPLPSYRIEIVGKRRDSVRTSIVSTSRCLAPSGATMVSRWLRPFYCQRFVPSALQLQFVSSGNLSCEISISTAHLS